MRNGPNDRYADLMVPLGLGDPGMAVGGETYYALKVRAGLFENHREPKRSRLSVEQATFVGILPRGVPAPSRRAVVDDDLDPELRRWVAWLRERPAEAQAVRDPDDPLRDERWLRRGRRQIDQLLERQAAATEREGDAELDDEPIGSPR